MKAKIYKDTKRFTGDYVGEVGGINPTENTLIVVVPNLPPTENLDIQKFYKWDTHEVQTGTIQVPVMIQEVDELGELVWEDEEKTIPKMIQDVDELGNPKFTEEIIVENITEWIFEEEAYNEWVEEQENIIPEPTEAEKIEQLYYENEMLNETLDYILTVLVPSMG